MPGGFPSLLEFCNGTDVGTSASTSLGTVITTGAANTKGSYAQLVASTSVDASWIVVLLMPGSNIAWNTLFDIAIGAGGSEVVIAPNLGSSIVSAIGSVAYSFPCCIPSGTRIAARAQADAATQTVYAQVILFDGAFSTVEGSAGLDSIGTLSASSTGTVITPSATANTKGSYAQLTASTSRDYIGFLVGMDPNQTNAGAGTMLLDIAIGAGGSEIVIVPNMQIDKDSRYVTPQGGAPFWIPIPSGTRVAARCQSSATSGSGIGLQLYGIYL